MTGTTRGRTPTSRDTAAAAIELPQLGAECADSHAHLDMLDDRAAALRSAGAAGVSLIATIADLTETPELTLEGLPGWRAEAGDGAPDVVVILGVHPHNARHWNGELGQALRETASADPRVVAVGELGLDFHYDHSPRDAQRRMFSEQLAIARELELPAAVHLREAHEEGLALLREEGVPGAGWILHCFTEGPETLSRFLELDEGVYVSFAGPITFKKADAIREAARIVPADRLLVETDCPFLAPAPYRGRPNEPALATLNVLALAEARGEEPRLTASACYQNARRLLGGVRPFTEASR
jgi:TatD DNase family protein